MTDIEKYEFDRLGYLVLPGLLKREEVTANWPALIDDADIARRAAPCRPASAQEECVEFGIPRECRERLLRLG